MVIVACKWVKMNSTIVGHKFGEFVFKPIESKASSVVLGGIFQDCLVMCNRLLVVASLVVPTKYQYLTCNTRLMLVG